MTPTPRFQPDGTQEQLERLSHLNETVTHFKGTASVVIVEKGSTQRFRIAWAGAPPAQLRMEILASGLPTESLAYDGKRLQLRSHMGSHPPYTKKAVNPSLGPTTGIPLTLLDIHALLSGKFFTGTFKSARRFGDALILQPTRNHRKTIRLDEAGIPTRVTLTKKNKTIYDLSLTRHPMAKGINQFKTIRLTTAQGIETTIRIDRMVVNPPIDSKIFTLGP